MNSAEPRKLFYHSVSIYRERRRSWQEESKFFIEEVEVLAENENLLVLNNSRFTRLEKSGKYDWHDVVGKARISIRTNDSILGDGVFYALYSEKRKRPSTIKKAIQAKIAREYGWLTHGLDLSIIR